MSNIDLLSAIDLTNCDREPIHIPGAILPHGAMLVVKSDTFEILQVAGNLQGLLGRPAEAFLGHFIDQLLSREQKEHLSYLSTHFDLIKPRHLLDPFMRVMPNNPLDASIHRSGDTLVLEFEEADLQDRFAADPLAGVQEMVEGFDKAGSLQALCQIAAERVRKVAGYDRVLVYKFMQDESGWVIAESRQQHLPPFLDLHYPAADIPKQARALYVKNWLRLITQVNYDPAPLIPANNPQTGQPLDMSQAILRDVSPIHRQYLRNMGIDASMSISIIRGGELWGLIACHNYTPRRLARHLRAVCELFGSMFSLQLEAHENGEQFGVRLASRTVLQNLMLNLASADDYAIGLTHQSPNLLDYIHGGLGAEGTLQGGVAVCVKGQLTFLGVTPDKAQIENLIAWLNLNMGHTQGVYATDRLSEVWPDAALFCDVASGLLVISVSPEPSDYIIWFRPELIGTANWAGEPEKVLTSGPNGDRLNPRKSFEIWKEIVRGRSLPWSPPDLDAAFDLRVSLLHVVLRRINAAAQERKRVAERDHLLMAELDHRVKNTIANIQALVLRTSRNADSLTNFVEVLNGRIRSMAKSHSLLSQSRWEGISIANLLHEELHPYTRGRSGVTFEGSDVMLTPKSALSLSLATHELATNAAKFGAYSQLNGLVTVSCRVGEDGGVHLRWRETGGPPVRTPTRRRFGSTLIERALAMETGGRAHIEYDPAGVICDIWLPASSVLRHGSKLNIMTDDASMGSAAATDQRAKPYRVLIVEDSFLITTILQDMFDDLGWQVVGPAARLGEALELARTETFDAALLDVNLDGAMSWDVGTIIKARRIPFVFSTGYGVSGVLPNDLAGSKVISKPFQLAVVEHILREIIEAKRAEGETPIT